MATTLQWVGNHGNNDVTNSQNWTPSGVPEPGDYLLVAGGNPVLDVKGNSLQGDTVILGDARFYPTSHPTFNLSNNAYLKVDSEYENSDTMNVDGRAIIDVKGSRGFGTVVNIQGHGRLITDSVGLGQNSVIAIHGRDGAVLENRNFFLTGDFPSPSIIDVSVVGSGNFNLDTSSLEFTKSVSKGQTIAVGSSAYGVPSTSILRIDNPQNFEATIKEGRYAVTDLVGLKADFYSIGDDTLSLYNGNRLVDKLHVGSSLPLTVSSNGQDTYVGTNGVYTGASALPLHSGA